MTKLSIPYPNNFNSLLTVHLYVDNFKNRVIMEVNEQNITTFVSADKFQKINQIQKVYEVPYVSFSINSEQGFLNEFVIFFIFFKLTFFILALLILIHGNQILKNFFLLNSRNLHI